jgi:hypothetical protein
MICDEGTVKGALFSGGTEIGVIVNNFEEKP